MNGMMHYSSNSRRRFLLGLAGCVLSGLLMSSTGWTEEPDPEDPPPRPTMRRTARDLRELAHIPLWDPRLLLGAQVELGASYEKQGRQGSTDEATVGVELALDAFPTDALAGHVLFSWEERTSRGGGHVDVDEAFARLGGNDDIAFYVEGGRMELPFGEYETQFIEDSLVQIIGETKDDVVTMGYEGDGLELLASLFRGYRPNHHHHEPDVVVALKADPVEVLECGVFWISDLGQSEELKGEIHGSIKESREEEEESGPLRQRRVGGLGAFLLLELDYLSASIEYVTALKRFEAGLLDDEAQSPRAWQAELAWPGLEVCIPAVRVEYAEDMPEEPAWQYGVSCSRYFSDQMVAGVEFLHGEFRRGEPNRDLVQCELTFVF